jgi:hypothetical protein
VGRDGNAPDFVCACLDRVAIRRESDERKAQGFPYGRCLIERNPALADRRLLEADDVEFQRPEATDQRIEPPAEPVEAQTGQVDRHAPDDARLMVD